MDIEKVREILVPYLKEKDLYLYDLSYKRVQGENLLQILIDSAQGITVDSLEEVNNYLSEELDKVFEDENEYMLEVSSPGAERPIRNESEIEMAIGKYIHLMKDGAIFEGTLISFSENVLTLRVNLKGRFKNFAFNYEEIKDLRYAVKF